MKMSGMEVNEAIRQSLTFMASKIPDADGGVIGISRDGNVGFQFNSRRMAWAYGRGNELHYGIERGEDFVEPLQQ